MSTLAQLVVKVGADVSGVTKGLKTVENKMQGLGQKIQATGTKMQSFGSTMTKAITLPIIGAAAASFKLASDMSESINKVDVAFKNNAGQVKAWSKTTLNSFGIARGTALDMAAGYGDMATSMGLSTDEAAAMSTSLVGLAGDLASFKNIGIDQANTALTAIFTGETESLKRLGVVMTQTNLDNYALSQGIQKKNQDMTQAEKVQLRYNYVMEQTKNAHGDFANTSDGAANQMRIFSESLKELGATMGENLLPIITPIIAKINDLVKRFGQASPETKKLIMIIAGLAAALGPLLMILGSVLGVIGSLTTIVAGLGISIAAVAAPIAIAIVAIAAIIAIGVLLYKNWDTLRSKARLIWEGITNIIKGRVNLIIKDINTLINALNHIPGVEIKPLQYLAKSSGTHGMADFRMLDAAGNANGTDYWRGGFTWVGERGPELVNLPRGTQIMDNRSSIDALNNRIVRHEGTIIHQFQTNDRQVVARIAKAFNEDNLRLPARVATIPI